MPVSIQVLEVGPKSPDQATRLQTIKRSSIFAKVQPSAMIVDPVSGEVWSNGGVLGSKGPYHGFVEKIATAPRENDADLAPPAVAIAPPAFPVVTAALLLALTAVFAAEIIFGIGPWTNLLQPTITTLIAFGGLTHNLVLVSGEWYRLLSGPFLHADAGHIAVNAIALALAGRTLERLIGPAWFGVVYVSGASPARSRRSRSTRQRSSRSAPRGRSWACLPRCWSSAPIFRPARSGPACR